LTVPSEASAPGHQKGDVREPAFETGAYDSFQITRNKRHDPYALGIQQPQQAVRDRPADEGVDSHLPQKQRYSGRMVGGESQELSFSGIGPVVFNDADGSRHIHHRCDPVHPDRKRGSLHCSLPFTTYLQQGRCQFD